MVDLVIDDIAAAAELLVLDALSIAELLLDEAEAAAEFLACLVLGGSGGDGVRSAAAAESFERPW